MLGQMSILRVAELEEVYTLAEQGHSLQEIAEIKGLEIKTIKQMIIDEEIFLKELREQFSEFRF